MNKVEKFKECSDGCLIWTSSADPEASEQKVYLTSPKLPDLTAFESTITAEAAVTAASS